MDQVQSIFKVLNNLFSQNCYKGFLVNARRSLSKQMISCILVTLRPKIWFEKISIVLRLKGENWGKGNKVGP